MRDSLLGFLSRHKVIGLMLLVDAVVVAVFVASIVTKSQKTALVDIIVAPSSASIMIGGKVYQNNTSYKLAPGEYEVIVSNDGFETRSFSINATSDKTTKIYTYLTGPNQDFSWYENNLVEIDTLKRVGQDDGVKKFLRKMSILDILPFRYNAFDEETQLYVQFAVERDLIDCPESFCLQAVNMRNSNDELIKDIIEQEGYNLDDYQVYYF